MNLPPVSSLLCQLVLLGALLNTVPGESRAAEPVKAPPCPRCERCAACPDDYRPKPLPRWPPAVCGGCCDDYHRKPLPCLPSPVVGCAAAAYCPKPAVQPACPAYSRWLKCPAPWPCGPAAR